MIEFNTQIAGCPQCNSRGAGRVCACSSVASHPILGPEFDGEENHPLRAANLSLASNRTVIWRCAADRRSWPNPKP